MLLTAVSTYWIRSDGGFSWLHLFSIATLAGLVAAVYYALSRRAQKH